jgi:hypothetical protein
MKQMEQMFGRKRMREKAERVGSMFKKDRQAKRFNEANGADVREEKNEGES